MAFKSMNTREKKFFVPIIKTYGNNLTKRWRVEYNEPEHNGHSAKRVVIYGNINAGKTIEDRMRIANGLVNSLNFQKEPKQSMLSKVMDSGRLQWRKKSIATYSTVVKNFEEYIAPADPAMAREDTINSFLRAMQDKGAKVGTLHKYRNILHRLYSKAVTLGLVTFNPVQKVPQIKREPQSLAYFSDAQIAQIKNNCAGPQLWLAIRLLFYCFIRPGEQRELKIGDINFEMSYIEMRGEVSKNHKTQKVAIPQHFRKEIEYLKEYPNNCYVLSRALVPGTSQISANWINNEHKKVLDQLQIRGNYAFYSWKHTGVVKCVQAGLNMRDIQNQLRHHSLDMVAEYLKGLGVLQSEDLMHRYPLL
jgi:integrase